MNLLLFQAKAYHACMAEEVNVTVVFFARARELVGHSSVLTRLPVRSSSFDELREVLAARFPAILQAGNVHVPV